MHTDWDLGVPLRVFRGELDRGHRLTSRDDETLRHQALESRMTRSPRSQREDHFVGFELSAVCALDTSDIPPVAGVQQLRHVRGRYELTAQLIQPLV
jgi:hypothetical protein